ncbi:hypothetical protein ABIA33_007169 [Streptacidiphilus sp. MAP12-16]|uniref:hypothetical protein n=1 Tax=Streptacidiphilus sp. MAP12-16 TaxID=3156300 RepID=UPI00351886B0
MAVNLNPMEEGQEAARELDTALRMVGFLFPSLRGDFPVHTGGHVQLGGLSAAEARRFAAWLRGQAR